MAISLRLNKQEEDLIRRYAELQGASVSEVMRMAILEKIEDEFDLGEYEAAMAEHRANPVVHSLADVEREIGLA